MFFLKKKSFEKSKEKFFKNRNIFGKIAGDF